MGIKLGPKLGGMVFVATLVLITSIGVMKAEAIDPASAPVKKNFGDIPPP